MKLRTPEPPARPHAARRRARFGYERTWWGRAAEAGAPTTGYWSSTRRPAAALIFVVPLLIVYELGVAYVGRGDPDSCRAGLDVWLRDGLRGLGLTDRWLVPMAMAGGLLAWQAADRHPGRPRIGPSLWLGTLVESLVLAVALLGLARVVDLGLARLDESPIRLESETIIPDSEGSDLASRSLRFLGAGLYEEAVFRLALLPMGYGLLRLFLVPKVPAGALAVTGSALAFALAHHAGAPGEPFSWYPFFFRWAAGVYFAWVFAVRGYGVAVGTHAAYDGIAGLFEPF